MATERLSMRKTKEILRQKWALRRTHREVALSVGVSTGAVSGAVRRAEAAGLDWAAAEGLSEEALEQRLYGLRVAAGAARRFPDPVWIHEERKRPGVTLQLLHMEYREQEPNGYGYTQFSDGGRSCPWY
jgi:transposase